MTYRKLTDKDIRRITKTCNGEGYSITISFEHLPFLFFRYWVKIFGLKPISGNI